MNVFKDVEYLEILFLFVCFVCFICLAILNGRKMLDYIPFVQFPVLACAQKPTTGKNELIRTTFIN